MSLQLGDVAPDFKIETTEGVVDFHSWLGDSWGVLFSHPADFTPVCTTELGMVARYQPEFKRRNVKVIALSVDSLESHREWVKDVNDTQHATVDYPIIADDQRRVSDLYGMIHPKADDTQTVRSVFVIDPRKKIRVMLTYPASTGRNFDELLRVIDSLQLTDNYRVATPANWVEGDDVVISPSVQDSSELKKLFPKGYREVRPYLRITQQPGSIPRRAQTSPSKRRREERHAT